MHEPMSRLFRPFALAASMAFPAAAGDLATCRHGSGDDAIAACTRAIESQQFKGRDLADLYYNRGVEYQLRGDKVRAAADREASDQLRAQTQRPFLDDQLAPRYRPTPPPASPVRPERR